MDYSAVPVACVDEHWMQQVFIPGAIMHLNSSIGLSLLPTDSPNEGNYLLRKIEQAFGDTREVHRISLDHRDPTICFMSIWGSIDSRCFSQIDPHTIFIRGGHYLPNWFLKEHLLALNKICTAFHKTLVLNVGRLDSLWKLQRSGIRTLTEVPKFSDYPQDTKRNFVKWAIAQYALNLSNDLLSDAYSIREQLSEIVIQKSPSSREQIIRFLLSLNDLLTIGDVEDYLAAATSIAEEHLSSQPIKLSICGELCRRFQDCCSRLDALRKPFKSATGFDFFRENQELPHAFDGGEPLNWRMSVVAFLGNLFIDAGKQRGLSIIDRFSFDPKRNDLVGVDGRSEFRDALHALRTFFFHGMDPANKDNSNTLAGVGRLMAHANPRSLDIRYAARYTLSRLLELLEDLVGNAERVVLALPKAPTAYMVVQRLERIQREVEDYVVKNTIRKTIDDLKLDLDPDVTFQNHGNGIRRAIAKSTCDLDNLHDALIAIVEGACLLEARRFPSIGESLVAHGLRNREVGQVREILKQEWDSNPQMTMEQLFARIPTVSESMIASREIQA